MISMQQRLHRGPNFGSDGFKDDPSPAPSRDLTEGRPAKSGRETPCRIFRGPEASGTPEIFAHVERQTAPPQGQPVSSATSLSPLSFQRLGSLLVSSLPSLTARSGVQPRPPLSPAPRSPPPLRPSPPLTSDPVSADPQLDINSRSPKSQPGDPSGPRAGARSPAQQVRGTSSQSWGRSRQGGHAGGGGQGSSRCRRRREKGEGCRQLPRRLPAPPEGEVRAAAAALVEG